jgi:UDP-glucose 4-epimerase
MRVLITGGAGFIGSHVVDQLKAAGHQPSVVDDLSSGFRQNVPTGVPFFQVDVRDAAAVDRVFAEVRPQSVCHQAAQMSVSRSVREPAFDAEVNILGLVRTLEAAAKHGVERFVFASSGGVLYGNVFEPANEDYPADPISPYGVSKWAGEWYLQFFAREHGMQTVALRYANVYGPRQSPHGEAGVVAIFCKLMLKGQQATINGDGSIVRDYVFVDDVANANLLALQSRLDNPFSAFNIGTGQATTVNELADQLLRECTAAATSIGASIVVPKPKHGPSRAGDLQSNLVSPATAKKILGWEPKVNLVDGVHRTVEWFATQQQNVTA